MISCYYVGDNENKFLNAGRRLCRGRKKFIVEIMEEKSRSENIHFIEMLRRLIWVDVGAADLILTIALKNLNK